MMRILSGTLLGTVLATLLLSNVVFAQKADEDAIKQLIYDYAAAYENITKSKDKETVLQYLTKDLVSTNVNSNIVHNVTVATNSLEGFSDYLDKVIRAGDLEIQYKIKDVIHVKVRGETGVGVYLVDYTIKKGGSIWSKGYETVSFTLQKKEDKWKIRHFSFISIEDEKNVGSCLCELYKGPTGKYVAKVTAPDGKGYSVSLYNFELVEEKGKSDRLLTYEDRQYLWSSTGDISLIVSGKEEDKDIIGKVLASASDEYEAMVAIVSKHLYKETCANIKTLRQKN